MARVLGKVKMLLKFRDNIFIGDFTVTNDEVKENEITIIEVVDGRSVKSVFPTCQHFSVSLQAGAMNKPHIKDIACHIPKHMTGFGEKILIISDDPSKQAAFVACRAICELEQKTIYETMMELKKLWPEFDIGGAYL